MVRLEAKKVGKNILISEKSFEHLLNCLDNQKYVTIPNMQTYKEKKFVQEPIDKFQKQCRNFFNKKLK